MEHQALLRNNLCLFILAIFSCQKKEAFLKKNFNDISITNFEGKLKYGNSLFSGQLFDLNGKDTLEIRSYVNGLENGVWKKFYPKHKLAEIRSFDNGKKTGILKAWWLNGKVKMLYNFENNEYNGTCKEWNEEGRLVIEMNYKNGYEDGSQKVFYDNGKIKANYVMKNGRRYGLLGTKNCVNASDEIF